MRDLLDIWKEMNIKLILWDIDGTILDFIEAQKFAIRYCFDRFELGECDDSMLSDYSNINRKYWEALERGEITKPMVLTGRFVEFFEKYGIDTKVVAAFNDEYQIRLGDTVCFFDGAMEIIELFKSQAIMQYAVTNGTKVAQDRKLAKSGLDRIFDGVFISEEVGYEKPNPKFFEAVLSHAQKMISDISRSQILIIGDSLTSDIKLGNNVGIKTCWYNRLGDDKGEMKVDIEIKSFRELQELLTIPK